MSDNFAYASRQINYRIQFILYPIFAYSQIWYSIKTLWMKTERILFEWKLKRNHIWLFNDSNYSHLNGTCPEETGRVFKSIRLYLECVQFLIWLAQRESVLFKLMKQNCSNGRVTVVFPRITFGNENDRVKRWKGVRWDYPDDKLSLNMLSIFCVWRITSGVWILWGIWMFCNHSMRLMLNGENIALSEIETHTDNPPSDDMRVLKTCVNVRNIAWNWNFTEWKKKEAERENQMRK